MDLTSIERKVLTSMLSEYRKIRKTCQFGTFTRVDTGNPHIIQWQAQSETQTVILRAKTLTKAAQVNDLLTVTGLDPHKTYTCREIQNPLFVAGFGTLLKQILPVKIRSYSHILLAANKRLKMDDYAEQYRASGAQLMAGVQLHRSFIGTGYSEKMHMQGDDSAMLFVITEDS